MKIRINDSVQRMARVILPSFAFALLPWSVTAQEQKGVTLSGSVQSDILIPKEDTRTGAEKKEDFQTNTYVDLNLQSTHIDAGLRVEYLEHPLPGFENDFKGWGVPHFYVKGKAKNVELTLGTFYEQFGSGFILRSYEERSLGIDNSLLGAHFVAHPFAGVQLKALYGKQRRYWDWGESLIAGADAELSIDEWFTSMQEHNTRLRLGASWVNKDEPDEDIFPDPKHRWNLPRYVNAWDVRANLNTGPWGILVEYAQKTQDPSFDKRRKTLRSTIAFVMTTGMLPCFPALIRRKGSVYCCKPSVLKTCRSAVGVPCREPLLISTICLLSRLTIPMLWRLSIRMLHSWPQANGLIRQNWVITLSVSRLSVAAMA